MKFFNNALKLYLLFVTMTCLYSCDTQSKKGIMQRPNVLFIYIDDLRPDLGSFGNEIISSPYIDNLASEGVAFTRAYCNVAVCGASRASIMTGTRPTNYRFLNFRSRADVDHPNAVVLPSLFKENGYSTVSLGKVFHYPDDSKDAWNVVSRPSQKGASKRDYLQPVNIELDMPKDGSGYPYEMTDVEDDGYTDGQLALNAIDYLQEFSQSKEPFFLAVGFSKPHLPFNAPKKYWDLYNPEQIGLASNPFQPKNAPQVAFHPWKELRSYYSVPEEGDLTDELALKLRHAYYACISYVDAQVGLLLEELEKKGLAENTIVVLLGDHGWNLGENALWGKHSNFNRSLNTPLIFKVPGLTQGKENNSITEFVDIYPTLCELTGLKPPSGLEGESLVNRLRNPGMHEKDYAVCKWDKGVTYIEGNYFYTEWYDANDSISNTMMYDHKNDPEENESISKYPRYAELTKELSNKLRERRGKDFYVDTSKQ